MVRKLWSIFTDNLDACMFTKSAIVERHHVFGGCCKKASEARGFVAPLRPDLHPNGVFAGRYAKCVDEYLKWKCYKYYLAVYGTEEDFREEFIRVPIEPVHVDFWENISRTNF